MSMGRQKVVDDNLDKIMHKRNVVVFEDVSIPVML